MKVSVRLAESLAHKFCGEKLVHSQFPLSYVLGPVVSESESQYVCRSVHHTERHSYTHTYLDTPHPTALHPLIQTASCLICLERLFRCDGYKCASHSPAVCVLLKEW